MADFLTKAKALGKLERRPSSKDKFKQNKGFIKNRKEQKITTEITPYSKLVQCPHCPGAYANEIIKFVGFRGRLEVKQHPKGKMVQFASMNIQGMEYPGEVHPKPIVPVTKQNRDNLMSLTGLTREQLGRQYFIGILEYEVEILTLLFTLRGMGYTNFMVLMARGVGKTYMEDWENAFGMKYFKENILLLSESDAMLKVGNWIYMWAFSNKYLVGSTKHAKQSTYQHFTLKNDAQLDIYRYMDKRTVGMHDIKIVGDDVVNLDWRNRPADNQRAIDHFASNLNNMIRTGLIIWGTRKYEGDLLQYFMDTIEDLVIIKQSPFIRCQCEESNINPQGTYNPCPICRDLCLLAPEIHSYIEYMQKMEENYESWYAEQMQDPHPRAGGMVEEDDIYYENTPSRKDVKMCGIGVDVAKVWEDTMLSDMTAVIGCIMWGEVDDNKIEHRRFTFNKEDVRRMPYRTTKDRKGKLIRGIIETIDKQWNWYKKYYPDKPCIIAIERDGPGITLIEEIMRLRPKWVRSILADKGQAVKWNKEGRANVALGINHAGMEKVARIFGGLRHSIKEDEVTGRHQTSFTFNMEDTILMTQLLSFPKGKHDDGPDAAEMVKSELNRRWSAKKKHRNILTERMIKKQEKMKKEWEATQYPWLAQKKRANKEAQKQKRKMQRLGLWFVKEDE